MELAAHANEAHVEQQPTWQVMAVKTKNPDHLAFQRWQVRRGAAGSAAADAVNTRRHPEHALTRRGDQLQGQSGWCLHQHHC